MHTSYCSSVIPFVPFLHHPAPPQPAPLLLNLIHLSPLFIEREKAAALSTPDLQKKIDEYINMSTATVRTAQVISTGVWMCVSVCMSVCSQFFSHDS